MNYRTVKRPAMLKASPIPKEYLPVLDQGVQSAIGVDMSEGHPTQIDIRYDGGRTFVTPIGGSEALRPWMFAGLVSPNDCRDHFRANPNPVQA